MPREEGGQTPALALTAYARTEDREREHVAAGLAAEDAVLVLHAHDIDRIHVQIIRGAAVRGDVVLGDLEANSRRIGMSMTAVVHCQHEAIEHWELDGDRIRQMSGE